MPVRANITVIVQRECLKVVIIMDSSSLAASESDLLSGFKELTSGVHSHYLELLSTGFTVT